MSLIVDTDGDDKADKEIIVATGWKEITQSVDAIGVTLDKDGNLYFGLGTANYANPYLVDKDGRGHYDVKSERGTILKVSPDFSKREIIATGVRFTIGLAFNHYGDLFATDQEGATWLANGNPFDELLHIQKGRHYGFPPRHPKYLPHVIDEPSVFDYGPQHQSTCGLAFDEPVNKGPIFGPAWWQDDALIAGYSRGKIYRTQLAKTPAGYVGAHRYSRLPRHVDRGRLRVAGRRSCRRLSQRRARLGQRAVRQRQALQDFLHRQNHSAARADVGGGAARGARRLRRAARPGRFEKPDAKREHRIRQVRPPGRPLRGEATGL